MPDPRSAARWRRTGCTAAAAATVEAGPETAPTAEAVPGLSALELRALAALRAAGGEGNARDLRRAGVTTTSCGAGLLLLDLQRAGLVERTPRGWRIRIEGEGP